MSLPDLPDAWRAEAHTMRERYGAVECARLLEAVAAELEKALDNHQFEPITRNQLAAEIGCHPDSVSRAASKGKIRNIGTPGKPRFRRADIHALKLHLRGRNRFQDEDGVAEGKDDVTSISPAIQRRALQSRR